MASDALPSPNSDGTWTATDLIKRLPLEKLVRTSTKIRHESENIERSLHGSVRRCYEQVDAAAKECKELRSVCASLCGEADGALAQVARACDECVKISDKMSPLRDRIEGLEESRRVMLLLRAAEVLSTQLLSQLTELTGLCTDPENARDRLFLTAHRCAIIIPQLEKLSTDAQCFKDAHKTLTNAVSDVVAELIAQVEEDNGSIEGLSLSDVLRIRVYLLIGDEDLRAFFLKTSESILRSTMPESDAGWVSGVSGLSRGAFQLRHAANVMLEDIKSVSMAYDDAFRGPNCFVALSKKRAGEAYADDTVLSSDEFAVWLSSTVDELIGNVVRKEVSNSTKKAENSGNRRISLEDGAKNEVNEISMSDLSDFKDAVTVLRKMSSTPESPNSVTSLAQVPIIIAALSDSICSHVEQTITDQATEQVTEMLDEVLFNEYSEEGNHSLENRTMRELRKAVRKIEELGENCDSLLVQLTSSTEDGFSAAGDDEKRFQTHILRLLVQKASAVEESKQNPNSLFALLRGAFICEEVAATVNSAGLKSTLRSVAESLRTDFTCRIVDVVSDEFRALLLPRGKERQLDLMISSGSSVADRVISLLRRARKEVDLYPTIGSALHDMWKDVFDGGQPATNGIDFLDTQGIDSDGVLHRIAENWVQSVRMCTLTTDKLSAVESVVSRMHESLNNGDSFHVVTRAAKERCSELC